MIYFTIKQCLILCVVLLVCSAGSFVLSSSLFDEEGSRRDLAHGVGLGLLIMSLVIVTLLGKIIKPIESLRNDLEQLTYMDVEQIVTEKETLSGYVEIQELQIALLQMLETVRNCKPFLPDTIIEALNDDRCRSIVGNESMANMAEAIAQLDIPRFVFGDSESEASCKSDSSESDTDMTENHRESVFLLSINDVPSSTEEPYLKRRNNNQANGSPTTAKVFNNESFASRRSTLPLVLSEVNICGLEGERRQSVANNLAGFEAFSLEHPAFRRSSIPTSVKQSIVIPTRNVPTKDSSLHAMLQFGMRRRRGTIMVAEFGVSDFIDYEGEDDLYLLASTLTGMAIDIVRGSGGNVLHLTADSLTGSWNTHHPVSRHSVHACRSAVSIRNTIEEAVSDDQDRVSYSVSIAGGLVYCGNIGNDRQRSPFVLGHLVDQARMLNQLSKLISAPLLMTESVVDTIRAQGIKYRPVDVVSWKITNRRREVVYELLTEKDHFDDAEWKEAFHFFMSERFRESLEKFEKIKNSDPQLRRLTSLIMKMEEGNDIPRPYARAKKGWETWDYTKTSPKLACRERSHRKSFFSRRGKDGETSLSSFTRKRTPSPTHGSDLLLAIQEIQRTETLSQASDGDSDNSEFNTTSVMTYDDPPLQFIENGCLFRRSERLLGKGAFGDVWLGMSEEGSLVAMKVIKVPPAEVPTRRRLGRSNDVVESVTSIINEVELLSKFHDDTIVSFISCGVHDKYVIIVMEYVSGGSLATVLETFGAIKLEPAKRFTRDILRGLHYLHGEGILHRDLKPGNVLMHTDGQCKLSDFGTCTTLTAIAGGGGGIIGTPLFMAPEAARGNSCKASDLWALGLTVIQMLQNRAPFAWSPDVVPTSMSFQFLRWLGTLQPTDIVPLPEIDPDTLDSCSYSFIKRLLVVDPQGRGDVSDLLFDPFVI